jgi:hypothetical protein
VGGLPLEPGEQPDIGRKLSPFDGYFGPGQDVSLCGAEPEGGGHAFRQAGKRHLAGRIQHIERAVGEALHIDPRPPEITGIDMNAALLREHRGGTPGDQTDASRFGDPVSLEQGVEHVARDDPDGGRIASNHRLCLSPAMSTLRPTIPSGLTIPKS